MLWDSEENFEILNLKNAKNTYLATPVTCGNTYVCKKKSSKSVKEFTPIDLFLGWWGDKQVTLCVWGGA